MLEIGKVEDFEEGQFRYVDHKGRSVGVVKWNKNFYAMNNDCPHQGGPVCRGHLGPKLVETKPGERSIEADQGAPVIACAWHGWEFDVATGGAVWDSDYRLKTYPVVVEDGTVFLDVKVSSRNGARA